MPTDALPLTPWPTAGARARAPPGRVMPRAPARAPAHLVDRTCRRPRAWACSPLATPAHLVVGVHQRAQVGEDVLHLAAVVELSAAHDAGTGTPARTSVLLDDAALARWCGRRRRRRRTRWCSVSTSRPISWTTTAGLVVLVLGVVAGDDLAADLRRSTGAWACAPRCWRSRALAASRMRWLER